MTDQFACFSLVWYKHRVVYAMQWFSVCFFLAILFSPLSSSAQNEQEYDEISVFFNVQRFGGIDLTAVIKDETVFLPVTDVFSFLKIKNNTSPKLDSITGFFINQQSTYLIDKQHNRITFQGKTFDINPGDILQTESNIYLKSSYFGQVFGLECAFNFRSLSVTLNTKLELPIIREMRQEQMRSNVNRLKGEVKTDTTINRSYPLFSFGMADWSIISTQQQHSKSDARINLTLGSVLAGGEANVSLNYNKNAPFIEKEQFYLWRFVNNDNAGLRQMMAGKISSQTTASIFNPIVGVQFTNTPTTYRRSFGTYTLSDVTEPGWIVELYVNSVLVDYVKADASGFYKFEVPLVYGNSAVMLRFYGPWGEERTREENISIPFNFLPSKEFEYTVSAGMVEDTLNSRYSRATLNYGLTPRMTIGGGLEYLSSVTTGNTMPFLNTSLRLASSLLFTGEYTYGVRFKGLASYRLPSNMQLELNYARYQKGQKAIIYNYLEERKAVISVPIKGNNFAAFTRLTLNQIVMENLKNTNAELLLSGSVYGVSTNFTTYGLFTDPSNPYIYSNLSLAFRFPSKITFTPQIQYEYLLNDFIATKFNLEKPLFKNGFLNLSYEQNFKSKITSVEMGLRYDFPFAQTGFSARQSNDVTSLVQSARGSLMYDRKTNFWGANNRTSVGKGGITFLPFLDLNCNGKHDEGEPKVSGLNLRVDGGRIVKNDQDTTIRVFDLIPYTSYFVELNKNSFENIAWQIKKLTMKISVDPNQFKTIEIPVAVVGEASGTVYEKGTSERIGKGRILVNFYKNDSILVARIMTEADGYFSFLGLAPGPYTARIDSIQLSKIHMTSTPSIVPVTVKRTKDGDVIDGLEFTLQPTLKDSTGNQLPSNKKKMIPLPGKRDSINKIQPVTNDKQADLGNKLNPQSQVKLKDTIKPILQSDNKRNILEDNPKLKNQGNVNDTLKNASTKTELKPVQTSNQKVGQKTENSQISGKIPEKEVVPSNRQTIKTSPAQKPLKTAKSIDLQGTVIQVGAFVNKPNATATLKRLESATGRKCIIVLEEGFYKVRVTGFSDRIEAASYIPKLVADGFSEAFVVVYHQGLVIQVDAFVLQENALAVQKKLILETGRPVMITFEDGFYKVRIGGFSGRLEAESFKPKLIAKGYTDCFIIRDQKTEISQ